MSKIRPQTEIFRQWSKIRADQSKQGEEMEEFKAVLEF
jgi:hypothetical protein